MFLRNVAALLEVIMARSMVSANEYLMLSPPGVEVENRTSESAFQIDPATTFRAPILAFVSNLDLSIEANRS